MRSPELHVEKLAGQESSGTVGRSTFTASLDSSQDPECKKVIETGGGTFVALLGRLCTIGFKL